MENHIPKERLFYYILLIGLLPIILAASHVFKVRREIRSTASLVETLHSKAALVERRQGLNKAVRKQFLEADHFYLDKHLEAQALLEPEREMLEKVISQKTFIADDKVLSRMEKLNSKNRIQFAEGVVQTYPDFQETIETLTAPVEVDVEDLKEILATIEGVDIDAYGPGPNRPQLIVTFFKIDKKKGSGDNEVFELSLRLLKREYL